MLLSAFTNLTHPDRQATDHALEQIRQWAAVNAWADFLEPRRLSSELDSLPPGTIADALYYLVKHGRLRISYRVRSPYTNQLIDQDYPDPKLIGLDVRDAMNNPIDTHEAEIVQVFVPAG